MPQIRSITAFGDVFADDFETPIEQAGRFLRNAFTELSTAGLEVQTRRFATQPFPQGLVPLTPASAVTAVQGLSTFCAMQGIDYLSIGPVNADDDPAYLDALEEIFATVPNTFGTVTMADKENGIYMPFVHRAATLIDNISRLTPDGMTNLFFAALANCPPFSPFFPVAYHGGGPRAFALAIQGADLANLAFENATDPDQARDALTQAITDYAAQVVPVAERLAAEHGFIFKGLDFSLAPFPTIEESLGGALEALGPAFGGHGLVAAASLIMNAVEAADFPSTGFSGLMLPILEDRILAERAAENRLALNDLLLLSTVCGTGLDCIPLPGDIGVDRLYAILLDVAALALRLDKPLTARLMPFPGKAAGDELNFDFEYFASSRVLASPASPIKTGTPLDRRSGTLSIQPRPRG
jgi:uncharacterized protein